MSSYHDENQSFITISQERFGRSAENYVSSTTHANQDELSHLVDLVKPLLSWHMLDVATGGGHTALAFAPYVASIIASDITPEMLAHAAAYIDDVHKCTNVSYELVDATAIPYENATFDLVTCRIAAHHFSDTGLFISEAVRTLKPGGFLLVQDQVMPEESLTARYIEAFEKLRDPSHNRAYSESEWKVLFADNNLDVQHCEIINRRHNFKEWTDRQRVPQNTVACLTAMLFSAPPEVVTLMRPHDFGTPDAVFHSQHIIILGKKTR